jgi:hypothetical protein
MIERNLKEDGIQAAKDIKLLLLGKFVHKFKDIAASHCFTDGRFENNE